jgi:hypothetical protein
MVALLMRSDPKDWAVTLGCVLGPLALLLLFVPKSGRASLALPPRQGTFAKLESAEGGWGAKVEGGAPAKGEELLLRTKAGKEVKAVVEGTAYEGKGYTLVYINVPKEKKERRKPLQRAKELADYIQENPGKSLRHYADWAAGQKTPTDRRVHQKPHWGYGVVHQAEEKGLLHVVIDTSIREGEVGYLKIMPFGADLPSNMKISIPNRLIRSVLEQRLPPEKVPPKTEGGY